MAKITIVRPYEWNNQRKRINVQIYDKKVGYVGIDETAHFEVLPGIHTLTLVNPWPSHNKTIQVDLSDDQNKTIKVTSPQKNFWIQFSLVALTTFIYSLSRSIFKVEASWTIEIIGIALLVAIVLSMLAKIEALKLEEI